MKIKAIITKNTDSKKSDSKNHFADISKMVSNVEIADIPISSKELECKLSCDYKD